MTRMMQQVIQCDTERREKLRKKLKEIIEEMISEGRRVGGLANRETFERDF